MSHLMRGNTTRVVACLLLLLPLHLQAAARGSKAHNIRAILSKEEFNRSGLHTLSAEQIALLNEAMARYYGPGLSDRSRKRDSNAKSKEKKAKKFGMPQFSRDKAKEGDEPVGLTFTIRSEANGIFTLTNGQVWRSLDPIFAKFEGKTVSIIQKGSAKFRMEVEGERLAYRVVRIK